ncbi:hypothetical protein D8674_005031 [Pyrus ussuriensis x Pyrus communis]|uniref:Uncharacterized protein n=1 Tax=Pyrus ussuriensis x Pyrus communis TaxID=2448454 RepID=A0A5N5G421_9ROSA|nr:hypothetical protein D8674_005031 [Pyrus ussuriensis x Pyrus communis]
MERKVGVHKMENLLKYGDRKREGKMSNSQEIGLLKVGVRDRRCEEDGLQDDVPKSGFENCALFEYSSVYSGGMWAVVVEPSTELRSWESLNCSLVSSWESSNCSLVSIVGSWSRTDN